MALKSHWEKGKAREAIGSSAWDYVVLQEQSTLPLKNRARMHEYITLFDQEIRACGAKTILYLTWARQHEFNRQDELSDAYFSIARKLRLIVAPVNVAWQGVIAEHPEIVLHSPDKSHPNFLGSYLAVCVFYAQLFHKSSVGISADVLGQRNVDPHVIRILQEHAWRSVVKVKPDNQRD